MTELKEELKARDGEGPVEYAERVEALLEEHRRQTGERLTAHETMPGESPSEVLERLPMLKVADGIRASQRARRRAERSARQTGQTNRGKDSSVTKDAADEGTRRFRLAGQEHDVERAVSGFEEAKKRLYRKDGSKVYGEEEHTERMEKLVSGLREKVEAVTKEAEEDATGYEREVLALSYTDPTKGLTGEGRERLTASAPLVKEDCEGMAPSSLVERLRAVSAGKDKVAKVLHARYARSRYEAESARVAEQARNGTRNVPATDTAALRRVLELAQEIEGQLGDPESERRREAFTEAAKKSRETIRTARRRLSEADGTGERARREMAERVRAGF